MQVRSYILKKAVNLMVLPLTVFINNHFICRLLAFNFKFFKRLEVSKIIYQEVGRIVFANWLLMRFTNKRANRSPSIFNRELIPTKNFIKLQ